MGRRLVRILQHARGALGALLFLLLSFALVPRTAVVVHTHAGGEHAHVHLEGEHHSHGGHPTHAHGHHHEFDHDRDEGHVHADSHQHVESGSRAPEEKRPGAVLQSAPSPAIVIAAVGAGAPHWHAQHPYLLCLPATCTTQALLSSLDRHERAAPRGYSGEPVALPFARGPPPISVFPTI